MQEEGKGSKAPIRESFGRWSNLKRVLFALFGLTAGQAVVWYTGQIYALFFLTKTLAIEANTASIMIGLALLLGTPFFVIFGALSDRIGRKPIIMTGCLLAALVYFPVFKGLTHFANPAWNAPWATHRSPSWPTRRRALFNSIRWARRHSPAHAISSRPSWPAMR